MGKRLPQFITIEKEVTGDPKYSMYNLSLREDWTTTKKFCSDVFIVKDPEDLPTHEIKHNGIGGKLSMVNGHLDHLSKKKTNGIKENGIYVPQIKSET